MRTSTLCIAAVFGLIAAGSSLGQILPKVPPAAPKTPEYVPPAPPPPPPPRPDPKPAEPAKPLASIILKDANGKVLEVNGSPQLAAIRAMDLGAETTKKVDDSLAARGAEMEKAVIEKLDKVLEARKVGATLGEIKDLSQLMKIKEAATPLMGERVLDRLARDGAITVVQKQDAERIAKTYEDALREQRAAEVGTDLMKIGAYAAKDAFNDMTRDMMAALDRMLGRAATKFDTIFGEVALTATQEARVTTAKGAVQSAADKDSRRLEQTQTLFFEVLDLDQKRELLRKTLPPPG